MPNKEPTPIRRQTPREIAEEQVARANEIEAVRRSTANRTLLNNIISGVTLFIVGLLFNFLFGIKEDIVAGAADRGLLRQQMEQLILSTESATRRQEETNREFRLTTSKLQEDVTALKTQVGLIFTQKTNLPPK